MSRLFNVDRSCSGLAVGATAVADVVPSSSRLLVIGDLRGFPAVSNSRRLPSHHLPSRPRPHSHLPALPPSLLSLPFPFPPLYLSHPPGQRKDQEEVMRIIYSRLRGLSLRGLPWTVAKVSATVSLPLTPASPLYPPLTPFEKAPPPFPSPRPGTRRRHCCSPRLGSLRPWLPGTSYHYHCHVHVHYHDHYDYDDYDDYDDCLPGRRSETSAKL